MQLRDHGLPIAGWDAEARSVKDAEFVTIQSVSIPFLFLFIFLGL